MKTRRKFLVALGGGLFAAPLSSLAQQKGKVWRIGFLAMRSLPTPENPDFYGTFVQAMRELGYIEGKNLIIEWRAAEGHYERLPGLAAELVRSKVEVIVTHSTPGTRAVGQATNSIPIVTAAVTDPVASGFAKGLARPGGNITGLSLVILDLSQKHVEFIKGIAPRLRRLSVLFNPDNEVNQETIRSIRRTADKLGLETVAVAARAQSDIEQAFAQMSRDRIEGVIVVNDAFLNGQGRLIAALALNHRLASMFTNEEDVVAGGLISYGQSASYCYRRAAIFVDKILKGARPSELPFEQPMVFDVALNMKTAKTLGLTIPSEIMVWATRVIR